MGITLYTFYPSDNCLRVETVLRELELEYEVEIVDLMKGHHKQDDYGAVNWRKQVPSLKDDDSVITESVACVMYLQQLYGVGKKSLLPTSKKELGECLSYIAQYHEKLNPNAIAGTALFGGGTKESLAPRIAKLKQELNVWEKILDGKDYLVGDISLADFVLFPFFNSQFLLLKLAPEEYPNLFRFVSNMRVRPSVKECGYWGEGGYKVFAALAKGVEFLA
ncbi:hypothetical protein NDN08_007836 [Rhodosorus marinus]|uniref:Glutathione transferase n=1 Tax=Rhodosorus marinus TaxID=101924 RepID=A0AAV8UYN6_9RHOD|nr:hypothetical protein NDN08_007836 [Rhodosorus marinus]